VKSEWLKIMLEEIARKKAEADQMLAEERRRRGESNACSDASGAGDTVERGEGRGA
jgi:hypothetical protein